MLLEIPPVVTVVAVAALGPIFGSFVTALSYRVPRGESIARGRSRCPACGHVLTAADLVPVISWLANRCRCRHCGAAVSARYPIIEALCFFLFLTTALLIDDPVRVALALSFAVIGLALAVIDFEHQQLPNVLVGLLLPIAILWRWRSGGDLIDGTLAAAVVLVGLLLVDRLFAQGPGAGAIGGGDVKVITLAALALPIPIFLGFLFVASASGLLLGLWWRRRMRQDRFPFGVTLVLAWWVCLILSPTLERYGF